MTTTADAAPHVFVIKGDIQNLACDAYMWASDNALRPDGGWKRSAPDVADRLDPLIRAAYQSEQRFTLPLVPRPDHTDEPSAILTAVPYAGVRTADDIVPRVREFFDVASTIVAERQPTRALSDRALPLLAVPLFGAGGGGGGPVRGEIFRVLYDECIAAAREYQVDVAIVLKNPRDYDLAQNIRRSLPGAWSELSPQLRADARRLGAEAAQRRLVPFMGAGISLTAGAPRWSELIEQLAANVGLDAETSKDLAENHDILDQAAYLHREYERKFREVPNTFAASIIKAVDVPRYGLAPALLSSLEAEQAITLNYDQLFERAADDAGLPRRVIPSDRSHPERWLLKLHGTVTDPASIILTREDYLGFNTDRAALSSLVKATLMTRRLLFAGFGVSDPHFHEIVHDVRRALPDHGRPFGTVLTLADSATTRRLWHGELDFVVLPTPRVHDIFLDALMAHAASTHSYLLAAGYAATLPSPDAALREALRDFAESLPEHARYSDAWPIVEASLVQLGWRSLEPRRDEHSESWPEVSVESAEPSRELGTDVRRSWETVDFGKRLLGARLRDDDVPTEAGVYAWYRDGECVYVGISGNLRKRLAIHRSSSRDLSRSTLRSWVAVHTLGLDRRITRRRPSEISQEQADAVTAWLRACEVAWVTTRTRDEAAAIEAGLLKEFRPLLNAR
jgi:hypothetical protein